MLIDGAHEKALFVINDFSKLPRQYYTPEIVDICGYKWNLLIHPVGNDVDYMSIYLNKCGKDVAGTYALFSINILAQLKPEDTVKREVDHIFSNESPDWGFTQFMTLEKLYSPTAGYLLGDALLVEVEMTSLCSCLIVRCKSYNAYLNSLLQIYYYIPGLRQAIYQIPIPEGANIEKDNFTLILQRILYHIQFFKYQLGTKALMQELGWKGFHFHAEDLDKIFINDLIAHSKGTEMQLPLETMFQGRKRNYVKCMEIDHQSVQEEVYHGISLEVQGCVNLASAFDKLVETAVLCGSNKYHVDGHGPQEAKKGTEFLSFPSILHLYLKKGGVEYTSCGEPFSYPIELDLAKYLPLSNTSPSLYRFFAVLTKRNYYGKIHYTTFLGQLPSEWWQLSNEFPISTNPSFMEDPQKEPCLLVYLRASDMANLVAPSINLGVHSSLEVRFTQEEEVKKQRQRERKLFMDVHIVTDAELRKGPAIDLVQLDKLNLMRVAKTSTLEKIAELCATVATMYDIALPMQRYWKWATRQNKTRRPESTIADSQYSSSCSDLAGNASALLLYLEPATLPLGLNDILIFFKHYDPATEQIQFVGHMQVDKTRKLGDLISFMNLIISQPPRTPLFVFEEVKPSLVDVLCHSSTLQSLELQNGDILIFQRQLEIVEFSNYRFPLVDQYFKFLLPKK